MSDRKENLARENTGDAIEMTTGALIFALLFVPTAAFAVKVDGQDCAGDAYARGDHWICRTHSGSIAEGQKSDVRGPGGPGGAGPRDAADGARRAGNNNALRPSVPRSAPSGKGHTKTQGDF